MGCEVEAVIITIKPLNEAIVLTGDGSSLPTSQQLLYIGSETIWG